MLLVKVLMPVLLAHGASQASTEMPASQRKAFRSWMVTIVEHQIERGANPRWKHRDCAGLVRFAVSESLARHDQRWRKANGFLGRPLPPELELEDQQRSAFKAWKNVDGDSAAFARALPLVQQNAVFLGKTMDGLEPGDLLFFDQGEDQHLMIWTGRRIVYHNGHRPRHGERSGDNGLRAVSMPELLRWPDTRWQPAPGNPNFIGFYRLSFLSQGNDRGNHRGNP